MNTATAAPPRDPQQLTRLMFLKLMPLLIAAYVLSFLDRTNIAPVSYTHLTLPTIYSV